MQINSESEHMMESEHYAASMPDLTDIRLLFDDIKAEAYNGVQGIVKHSSGRPGPTLGISMCAHGNEPGGLAALWYFLENVLTLQTLQRGAIVFILNNVRAVERYFEAVTDAEKTDCRYIDVDMNRIPHNVLTHGDQHVYEIARARELYAVYKEIDVCLDIHSTHYRADPSIIALGREIPKQLIAGFPMDVIISNIDRVQTGIPLCSAFTRGNPRQRTIAIEAGMHEESSAFATAARCTVEIAQNLGILARRSPAKPLQRYRHYYVNGSVVFPNASYRLVKDFVSFETIRKGQTLATGAGAPLIAPGNGHTLFGETKDFVPKSLQDEALFLTEPAQVIHV